MNRGRGEYRPPTYGSKRKRLIAALRRLREENIRRGRVPPPEAKEEVDDA